MSAWIKHAGAGPLAAWASVRRVVVACVGAARLGVVRVGAAWVVAVRVVTTSVVAVCVVTASVVTTSMVAVCVVTTSVVTVCVAADRVMAAEVAGAAEVAAREESAVGELAVDVHTVLMPWVDESDLSRGQIGMSSSTGAYAVRIAVRPLNPECGWVLWVRALDARFQSTEREKPCRDLHWKHDDEPVSAYRPVSEHGSRVFTSAAGGQADLYLDLMATLDWETAPGSYRLELSFQLEPLE